MNIKKCLKIFMVIIAVSISGITGESISAQGDDVVVIMHTSKGTLSSTQLKRIFTGEMRQWPDGGELVVMLNANKNLTAQFCKKYLRISSSKLEKIWVKKEIRDGVKAPRKMASNVITTMVGTSNKFIGYVKRSETTDKTKVIE